MTGPEIEVVMKTQNVLRLSQSELPLNKGT